MQRIMIDYGKRAPHRRRACRLRRGRTHERSAPLPPCATRRPGSPLSERFFKIFQVPEPSFLLVYRKKRQNDRPPNYGIPSRFHLSKELLERDGAVLVRVLLRRRQLDQHAVHVREVFLQRKDTVFRIRYSSEFSPV